MLGFLFVLRSVLAVEYVLDFFPFQDLVYVMITTPICEMCRGQELLMLDYDERHLLADNDSSDFWCCISNGVVVIWGLL